jgi:hypothetical protein
MKLTITEISMHPEEESPIFSDQATRVRLEDGGGGKFVSITQDTDAGTATIRLDFKEVEWLVKAITLLNKEAEK